MYSILLENTCDNNLDNFITKNKTIQYTSFTRSLDIMQNKESEILVFLQRKTWETIEFENYKGITCEKRKKI